MRQVTEIVNSGFSHSKQFVLTAESGVAIWSQNVEVGEDAQVERHYQLM